MTRYVALLRAINVGGHTVKMDALRKHFSSMGFTNVETFIASGNVIFDAKSGEPEVLEARIAAELENRLGYAVATFLRTPAELAAVVRHQPFEAGVIDPAQHALYIGFLARRPGADTARKVAALRTGVDEFHVHKRELYWGCRTRLSESAVSGALLERTIAMSMTMRNITTVRKLAAKLA
ncbi:MAG TPA: DUF1697 domain-containing protein [Gemmatimonadaceae bacterium]|nr:DUF1697 domain-containing protein [Gemmatimonadaceae bacterium]